MRQNFVVFRYLLALLALCFSSCQYQADFDALAAFPANGQKKPFADVQFVKPDLNETEQKLATSQLELTTEEQELNNERFIGENVVGVPFTKMTLSSGEAAGLNCIELDVDRDELCVNFDRNNIDYIRSPFTATGMAVGDVNGDQLPDFYIASQKTGGQLFLNTGGFKFKDVTKELGLSIGNAWGVSATMADVNNDGLLDIYVCVLNEPNRLFINLGRKFSEQANRYGLDFTGASVGAHFCDYDRDGDLDMYLVTHRIAPNRSIDQIPVDRLPGEAPRVKREFSEQFQLVPYKDGGYLPIESGQYDYLMRNDDGTFVDATEESKIGPYAYRGMAAKWLDFNDDGWP
ncbi:MAG: VCBS repeat-containing protein, partial [Planctomycetota bacterium]